MRTNFYHAERYLTISSRHMKLNQESAANFRQLTKYVVFRRPQRLSVHAIVWAAAPMVGH
eukprot:SAG25_NODE_1427_length_3053_cov_55.529113_3_plen_60_part_00